MRIAMTVFVLLAIVAPADAGPRSPRAAGEPDRSGLRRTDSDYALSPQQALWAKISEVRFEKMPLRDAFDWLREVLGTNLHVDWGALAEVGVTPDQPIELHLRWVRVPRLLRLIFQETGRGQELTYHIADNILVITSTRQADSEVFTRVYPVQDLVLRPSKVDRIDRSVLAPAGAVNGRGGSGAAGGWGDRDSRFRRDRYDDDDDDDEDSDTARGREIVEMIKRMTPAETWQENGGRSTITYFRGNLVLTAPRSVHALIAGPIRE